MVLPDSTRAGYTFGGWYESSSPDTLYPAGANYTPKEDITLYAKWNANTYTVSYEGNGNTGGSTADSEHTYDTPSALTANGFERKYNVSYVVNGGSACETDTAAYIFTNWAETSGGTGAVYDNSANVINLASAAGDTVTLYAQWESVSVTLPVPTKTGYTFGGWYADAELNGADYSAGEAYTPETDITLYAAWNANAYTVSYDGGGSTGGSTADSEHTYDVPSALTPNGFEREYTVSFDANGGSDCETETAVYTFNGWSFSGNSYGDGETVENLTAEVNGSVTLTAQWNSVSVVLPEPTREGYAFDGWFISPELSDTGYSAGESYTPAADTVFYAKWQCIHIYGEEEAPSDENLKTPASCTDKAVYYMVCARCGDVNKTDDEYTYEYGEPLGHAYGGTPVWSWADDYSSATATFACANDASHTDTVTAEASSRLVGVTCTDEGVKEYTATVTYNDDTYTDIKEVAEAAAGHNFSEAYTTDREPTCSAEGEESIHCTVCDAIKEGSARSIEKLPHTPKAAAEENKTEPSCTKDGSYDEVVQCEVCKTEISREQKIIKAVGHTPSEWQEKTPATEDAEGVEIKVCPTCGEVSETKTTEKLPHSDGSVTGKVEPAADEGAIAVEVDPIPSDEIIGNVELTDEEQEAVANGDNIEIVLEVKSLAEENVPAEDKLLAEAAAAGSGNEIELFVDMELILKNLTTGEERKITEANGVITIVIIIPDEIYSDNKTYSMVRVHDGAAENIGGELDRENRTLTIKTDKFSTYAITSSDVEAASNESDEPDEPDVSGASDKPDTPDTPDEPDEPDTSDDTHVPALPSSEPDVLPVKKPNSENSDENLDPGSAPENNNPNPNTGLYSGFMSTAALLAAIIMAASRKRKK